MIYLAPSSEFHLQNGCTDMVMIKSDLFINGTEVNRTWETA